MRLSARQLPPERDAAPVCYCTQVRGAHRPGSTGCSQRAERAPDGSRWVQPVCSICNREEVLYWGLVCPDCLLPSEPVAPAMEG